MNQVISVFACLVLGLAAAFPVPEYEELRQSFLERQATTRSDINKDVHEFIDLIPRSKIEEMVQWYVDNDAEVASNVEFLNSDYVKEQALKIESSPEFAEVRRQLEAGGLRVSEFINLAHDMLGWERVSRQQRAGAGLRGLLMDEIRPAIPMTKIKLLAAKKFIFSSAFRKMVGIITDKHFQDSVAAIVTSQNAVELEQEARNNGVDVDAIYEFASSFTILYKFLLQVELD